MKKIGIYIHTPFCRSKCPYCGFYSERADRQAYDEYTLSVVSAMEKYSVELCREADTLYLGGGTPSLLGGKNIALIIAAAKRLFHVDGEITVECNPSCVEDGFFDTVAEAGANRVSIGLQSAVDSERRQLGRLSDARRVAEVIRDLRASGIGNISLDVMIGIPKQTPESLAETLEFCAQVSLPHVSAYMLSLEKGTYFYKNAARLELPDEDMTARLYEQCGDFLCGKGYVNYEISNFAMPGFESRHNLKYWNCEEYLGIGPAAHSFIDGKRFFYPRDRQYFMDGGEPVSDGEGGSREEYVMLRLRLAEGIVFADYEKRFGEKLPSGAVAAASAFAADGLMRVTDRSMSLTRRGFLLSNPIIAEIEERL